MGLPFLARKAFAGHGRGGTITRRIYLCGGGGVRCSAKPVLSDLGAPMVGFSSPLKSAHDAAAAAGVGSGMGPGVEPDAVRGFARSSAPLAFPAPSPRERSPSDLARMIEGEIIPRLMLAHKTELQSRALVAPEAMVGPRTLETFVRMTVAKDTSALVEFVESLIQGGLSLQDVYADLLSPTARRLGDDWNSDAISFTDVSIGLSRLQHVVRALAWKRPPRDADADASSAYFLACPGEQHTFGLFLLEDEFRRAGWRTVLDTAASAKDAASVVASDWFDVFGLSATTDVTAETIVSTISAVRAASCNRNVFVMVGGRIFIDDPGLALRVGADAVSATSREALHIAGDAVRPSALG